MVLAPVTLRTSLAIDMASTYMATELGEMDPVMFHRKRQNLRSTDLKYWPELLDQCKTDVDNSLIFQHRDVYQAITDEQIEAVVEILNFFLVQYKSRDPYMFRYCRSMCITLILQLIVVLLESNRQAECEAWIGEHFSELTAVKLTDGASILHLALIINVGSISRQPIVKLLVEKCKINVNVEDDERQTPLHWLSDIVVDDFKNEPTEEVIRVAEILIDNDAHMDATDVGGRQASRTFSRLFPRWRLNSSLKCLAAKAILEHELKYETIVPKQMVPFIQSHKQHPILKRRLPLSSSNIDQAPKRKRIEAHVKTGNGSQPRYILPRSSCRGPLANDRIRELKKLFK